MENNIADMKKRHEREIKELQENCNHPETVWAEEWWALGHSTGYKVKVCKKRDA